MGSFEEIEEIKILFILKLKHFYRYIFKYLNIIRAKAQTFWTKDFFETNFLQWIYFYSPLRDEKVLRVSLDIIF